MKHATEKYFLKSKGWLTGSIFPRSLLAATIERFAQRNKHVYRGYTRKPYIKADCPAETPVNDDDINYVPADPLNPPQMTPDTPSNPDGQKPERIFCQIFPEVDQLPNADALIDLGLEIETETHNNVTASRNSNIPAGYTYLGQFIDHDITATPSSLALSKTATVDPSTIDNARTPSLDLDCVYGFGPGASADLFESDGVKMRVGSTVPTEAGEPGGPIPGGFPNDLIRKAAPGKEAIIGDGRNDENLAVAQTQVAFIKYHNLTADRVKADNPSLDGMAWFEATKKEVVLHYQAIVLGDFLPRIIENAVLHDVLVNGNKFYTEEHEGCMPIEFSVGAYRLGHSMVRPSYEWNRVFNSKPGNIAATFSLLFEFSGVSGTRDPNGSDQFFGKDRLPSNWIVDWTQLYDFSSVSGLDTNPEMNFAREIDTSLAMDLKTLPEIQRQIGENPPPEIRFQLSLASRNLLRGRMLKMATGQQVAQAMLDQGIAFTPITADQIADSPHGDLIRANGFDNRTPLWYYVLREAKVRHNGNKLGPVGSRILAEVFVGLIRNGNINLLDERPGLSFSMPELLMEVGDLNPLGN